jgi:hypothetical protein
LPIANDRPAAAETAFRNDSIGNRMAMSPSGSAPTPKGDGIQDLQVGSPPAAPDLVALARAGTGPAQPSRPQILTPRPSSKTDSLSEIAARKPPGPQAKPAPAAPPLKGPAPAQPPAYVAAAAAAAARAAAIRAAAKPASAPPGPPPAAAAPSPAAGLIDESAPWLPEEPERKSAFLQVFRYWHAQVRPEQAHKARPAFLFLVTAVPVMVEARDTLAALDLWEPHGDQSRQRRDQHAAWKKYCEFLPRAQQALQELDDYRHLSLLTALDDLDARLTRAEKAFRVGPPQPAKRR